MKNRFPFAPLLLAAGLASSANAQDMTALPDIHGQVGFVRNEGQVKDQNGAPVQDILYMADVDGIRVQLRRTGFSYQVMCGPELSDRTTLENAKYEKDTPVSVERIDFDLAPTQAGAPITVVEREELPGVLNFIGEKEIYGVKSFRSVTFVNAWTGADLLFEIATDADHGPRFKYSVIARAGTDIASLGMTVRGLANSSVQDASMRLDGMHFGIEESIPESWLVDAQGVRTPVRMAYASNNERSPYVQFTCADAEMGVVPAGRQLVIDPTPNRLWGRYYGGGGAVGEVGGMIAVKNSGTSAIALGGSTVSPGLGTAGVHQVNFAGGAFGKMDGHIAKFNSAGAKLWATYYGTGENDLVFDVAFDASGEVYACGSTESHFFLSTTNSHQANHGGGPQDGFLVRFDGATGQRKWGTYYGGSGEDRMTSLAVDGSGNIHVGGETTSPHTDPIPRIHSPGAWQPALGALTYPGYWDAFLVKFNSLGVRQWGTYYGGSQYDGNASVTTDDAGDVYLGGQTKSTNAIATPGPNTWQPNNGGGDADGFLAKFAANGSRIWSTYYGGTVADLVTDVSVDCNLNVWICGETSTPPTQLAPYVIATPGAFQPSMVPPFSDGFMAKFSSIGVRLYGSYYGGSAHDFLLSACTAGNNLVYFGGYTESTSQFQEIATTGSWQTGLGGGGDGFVTLFNTNGTRTWGTYYGGTGSEGCSDVEYFTGGKIVISGATSTSTGPAIASAGTYGGGPSDWFIAQFDGPIYSECIPAMPLEPTQPAVELCELMDDGVIHEPGTGTLKLSPALCTSCGLNVFNLSGQRVFTTNVTSDRVALPADVNTKPFIVQVVTDKDSCSKVIVPDASYVR